MAHLAASKQKCISYQAFYLARHSFDPHQFGVDLNKGELIDQMCEEFNSCYRGQWTVDELLLHPQEALQFCNDVRRKHGYFDLPDDIILRSIMQRRKNADACIELRGGMRAARGRDANPPDWSPSPRVQRHRFIAPCLRAAAVPWPTPRGRSPARRTGYAGN